MEIGDLNNLNTQSKTTIVDAINELKAELDRTVVDGINMINNITRNL